MKQFDIQSIELTAPARDTFAFIADPHNLPKWAQAFKKVSNGRATLQTPNGTVEIELKVEASGDYGTIDWVMKFADGVVARACSRVVPLTERETVYTFVLLPPPVPLEQLEGALEQQSRTLKEELARLKTLLEKGAN
jgi:hypothetical protein